MSDFLTTFLASILQEQGVENPHQVAARAAADLRKARVVNDNAVKRAAIIADPCGDYKIVSRTHGVPVSFVYRAWSQAKLSRR